MSFKDRHNLFSSLYLFCRPGEVQFTCYQCEMIKISLYKNVKVTGFWDLTPSGPIIDVSEEAATSIFWVEDGGCSFLLTTRPNSQKMLILIAATIRTPVWRDEVISCTKVCLKFGRALQWTGGGGGVHVLLIHKTLGLAKFERLWTPVVINCFGMLFFCRLSPDSCV
jgi:hypothetical protein